MFRVIRTKNLNYLNVISDTKKILILSVDASILPAYKAAR
jgi:hypothetical protein